MATGTISEQALIRRIVRARTRLTRAAVNAVIAARNAPGTLRQLAALIQQGRIEDAVQAAAQAGAIEISRASAAVYLQSGAATAASVSTILEATVDFDQVHDLAVSYIRSNRLELVREWSDAQRRAAHIALERGVQEGANPIAQARRFRETVGLTARQEQAVQNYRRLLERAHEGDLEALTRQLRDRRFDRSVERAAREATPLTREQIRRMVERYRARSIKRRAETIARTEAHRSVMAGTNHAIEQVIEQGRIADGDVVRTWVAAADERVREDHANADGQKVGPREPFIVGGAALMYPGDPAGPPEQIINCFLPGTGVRGRFEAGVRSSYEGDAVDIETVGGRRLRVTPNHPIATARGMMAARQIGEADYLVAYEPLIEGSLARFGVIRHRDNQDAPSAIEKVFGALSDLSPPFRSRHVRVDFRGDERFVQGDVDIVRADRHLAFGCDSKLAQSLDSLSLEIPNTISSRGGATAERLEAILLSAACLVRSLGEFLPISGARLAHAGVHGLGSVLDGPASFQNDSAHRWTADADFLGEGLHAHAGVVKLDKVRSIKPIHFSGHVYDLQEASGLMIADGIVVSNCRCSFTTRITT